MEEPTREIQVSPSHKEKIDKEAEVGRKWSEVMDRMEDAAKSNGHFFVSVGGKDTLTGFTYHGGSVRKDTRALILTDPIEQTPNELLFVAITASGVKGIKYDKERGDEIPRDAESRFRGLRHEGAHEEEWRSSYRRWRRNGLNLPDIVAKMANGEKLFREQDDYDRRIGGFSEKDNMVTFGWRKPSEQKIPRHPYANEDLAPIEYSLIPVEDMDLVKRAFEASCASAESHKGSPRSPKTESPEERSGREAYVLQTAMAVLENSVKEAGKVLAIVQEGLPPQRRIRPVRL